jgi:phage terminase large subunit-like protein
MRAEPILSFYERGKVHHVGAFPALEDQMCSFTGARERPSPDRLDALVWALTELMVETRPDGLLEHYRRAYETLSK